VFLGSLGLKESTINNLVSEYELEESAAK
jgi:hypothetical protein